MRERRSAKGRYDNQRSAGEPFGMTERERADLRQIAQVREDVALVTSSHVLDPDGAACPICGERGDEWCGAYDDALERLRAWSNAS